MQVASRKTVDFIASLLFIPLAASISCSESDDHVALSGFVAPVEEDVEFVDRPSIQTYLPPPESITSISGHIVDWGTGSNVNISIPQSNWQEFKDFISNSKPVELIVDEDFAVMAVIEIASPDNHTERVSCYYNGYRILYGIEPQRYFAADHSEREIMDFLRKFQGGGEQSGANR